MIKTKNDLKIFLREDKIANLGRGKITFFTWLKMYFAQSQRLSAYRFLKALRYHEYYLNVCAPRNPISVIMRYFSALKLNWASRKYRIDIPPNCVGYGFRIHHINAGGIVFSTCKVGNYADIRQCTTIGIKNNSEIKTPTIGNNVFIGCNVSIIGDVTIGDNVTIGAGSVVVKNLPSNCVAVGNPCRVIYFLENGKQTSNG